MKRTFLQLFEKKEDPPFIPIVSGLSRSGTSLMMSMLAAGGLDEGKMLGAIDPSLYRQRSSK